MGESNLNQNPFERTPPIISGINLLPTRERYKYQKSILQVNCAL
jgi:hypothetical protein